MWKQWNRNTLSYYSKEKDTGTDKKSLWVGVLRLRAGEKYEERKGGGMRGRREIFKMLSLTLFLLVVVSNRNSIN